MDDKFELKDEEIEKVDGGILSKEIAQVERGEKSFSAKCTDFYADNNK